MTLPHFLLICSKTHQPLWFVNWKFSFAICWFLYWLYKHFLNTSYFLWNVILGNLNLCSDAVLTKKLIMTFCTKITVVPILLHITVCKTCMLERLCVVTWVLVLTTCAYRFVCLLTVLQKNNQKNNNCILCRVRRIGRSMKLPVSWNWVWMLSGVNTERPGLPERWDRDNEESLYTSSTMYVADDDENGSARNAKQTKPVCFFSYQVTSVHLIHNIFHSSLSCLPKVFDYCLHHFPMGRAHSYV